MTDEALQTFQEDHELWMSPESAPNMHFTKIDKLSERALEQITAVEDYLTSPAEILEAEEALCWILLRKWESIQVQGVLYQKFLEIQHRRLLQSLQIWG